MIENLQEQLIYLTDVIVRRNQMSPKIRGVMAEWEKNNTTAHLSFYFDGEPTEDEIEEASDTCGEIIAHFPGFLKEDYIPLNFPNPLPESPFWAYRRSE